MQFFCVGSAESLAFTGAGFTGKDGSFLDHLCP